jgi:hypothetical protein
MKEEAQLKTLRGSQKRPPMEEEAPLKMLRGSKNTTHKKDSQDLQEKKKFLKSCTIIKSKIEQDHHVIEGTSPDG